MIKHTQTYDRHSVATINEVLNAIKTSIDSIRARQKPVKALINGLSINAKSLRLQTFLEKGIICVKCGRTGTHFAIERSANQEVYHLNLWATDEHGDEYLMTHDHIIARSLGGADKIENTQPMCSLCNAEKGVEELKLLEKEESPKERKKTKRRMKKEVNENNL
jgi:5-methylcytosine-specific restriction endonuclease McrA